MELDGRKNCTHPQNGPKAHPKRVASTTKLRYPAGEKETSGVMATKKLNSVALVRERTIPTERPPPVGEVSANFCG
jgi:hypothetical protein